MAGVGTTHHLKLGTEFLIVRPNTYQKSAAPTFGARITTGDPDYNNLSIWQHWVQKCWIGGMDADEWVDDAMYKEGVGLDTTQHEKMTLSRHLKRGSGSNWTTGGSTEVKGRRFIIYHTWLFCLVSRDSPGDTGDSRLYYYTPTTETWTSVNMPGSSFYARCVATYDAKLFIGGVQTAGTDVPALYYVNDIGGTPSTWAWVKVTNPVGIGSTWQIGSMRQFNRKLYVAFGVHVWRLNTEQTWDGNTEFYASGANSGGSELIAMEVHLGFLYMLSSNGHLHRSDGNNTFDIWSWDGQTMGVSLRSYDGKLFVGTYEYTDTVNLGYGVLYQFTGAAVTELKRWGDVGKMTSIGQMMVYGRKLYYGASSLLGVRPGFGVAVYDSVEDAHSIFAVQDNVTSYPDTVGAGADWLVDDVIVFGGKLFAAVRGYGIFFTEDSFRDVERNRAQFLTSSQGGQVISSMYDGGTPGLMKLWRRITAWCTLPTTATTMVVSYSLNAGVTWVDMPTVTGGAGVGTHHFYLNNIRSPDFMYKVKLRTTDETKSPVFRGISVSYLPQPEPNWMWSFVIPVADKWELMDETIEVKNTNTLIAYLENLFRTQQLVNFVDIDGKQWAAAGQPGVLVYDMNVLHYDVEVPREADVRITLLETVETF